MQELSLAALAKAMGMSAPALYRYFPSRDALVEAPVVAALARWGRQAGAFESMGIDGELLLTSELEVITRNGC